MLFINFLCLFYLMVLVTSHTISKSIATTESFDGIDDSFNDIDLKRNHRAKHDRIHQRHETFWSRSPETRSITEIILGDAATEKHGRKTARNLLGLWKKYHNRKAKNKSVQEVQIEPQYSNLYNNLGTRSGYNNLVEYVTNGYLKSPKEAISKKRVKVKRKKNRDYDLLIEDNLEKPPMKHRRSLRRPTTRHSTRRPNKHRYDQNENITNIIGSMSTKLDELKKLYSTENYSPLEGVTESVTKNKNKAKYKSLISESDSLQSTVSLDNYEGTAAIEAILNEVKCRAIDMIASQRPGLSGLITNAVTETTYSVDPLLKRMNVINPLIAISTLVTMNELPDNEVTARAMKKEVTDSNLGYYIFKTESTRRARSAQKVATTPGTHMEEGLQGKLKTIFQKVKEDLDNIRAVNKKIQNSLKLPTKSAAFHTATAKLDGSNTAASKDLDDEVPQTSSYHGALDAQKENVPSRHKNEEPVTLSTIDASMFEDNDYDMLSVYEHILAKTQESNMMKYLSTKLHPAMRRNKQAPAPRIKKEMRMLDPDDAYPNDSFDEISTDLPVEETSFEALTQKLAYNDFVNGYKHYLKFEKDMAQQNFSNLVRYQAHKHHSVDEIGKYILDKIPQIPSAMQDRFKRNFFDYYDDDQDISTQNDDSWIKKYFNYFVEHSPTPKKYHTSQTVPMKAPVEYKNQTKEKIEKIDHKDFLKNHVLLRTHTVDMDLDQLTHMIEQESSSSAHLPSAYSFSKSSLSLSPSDHATERLNHKDFLRNHGLVRPQTADMDLEQLTHMMKKDKLTTLPLPFPARQKQRSTSFKKERFNQNLMAIKNALSPHNVDKFFSEFGRSAKKFTNKKYNNENTEEAVVEDGKRTRSRRGLENDKLQIHQDDPIDQAVYEEHEAFLSPKPKALADLVAAAAEGKKPKEKIGYASVDVVPASKSQTVKKKSKFMTWLNKLKWHKKKSKPKRQAERVPRFNIVKKLKQLFDGKADKFDKYGLSDYDLATTKLEGFSPIKYDSAQHIHDIQKQLPEITDNRKTASTKYAQLMKHRTLKKPAKKKPNLKKHGEKYHTIITANLDNFSDGTNFFNPTQQVDSAKIQQIKHEIDNIDLKLSSTTTRARIRNEQSRTSQYSFDGNPMNSEDLESPGRSESDAINLNPLTERPGRLDHKNTGEKARNILTRDAQFHFSQFHNYDDYNPAGQMAATEAETDVKKRDSSSQNYTNQVRTIANVTHKVDPSQDATTTTVSYDDTIDDFDDLIIWNNNILDSSDTNWSSSLKKMNNLPSMPEKSENITDQLEDFLNSSKASKNQSDDDIGELSTNLHNSATKYYKPVSGTTSSSNQHRSDKKPQPQMKNLFLDDDRIVTSEVMLKRLNSFNSILGRPEERLKNIYVKKNNKPGIVENLNDRDVVDSTLFAYDDGYGFFTDENRKLSKNQVDLGNSTTSLTTITPPPQRYTTPLPMKPHQFDKFLKYNELDVQTVTSPIPETPDMGAWAHKQREEHNQASKTEPYDEAELKRKLHIPVALSKNLNEESDERKTRNQVSRQIPDESEMIWPNLEFNYRDLKQSFKRKLKFNRPEEKSLWMGKTFSASTKGEKQIELTLINFENEDMTQGNDFDLNYYDTPYNKEEQTEATKPASTKAGKPKSTVTTENTDSLMKTEKISKAKLSDMDPRVALKVLHNQLMYKNSMKLKAPSEFKDTLRFSHLHKQQKVNGTPSEREGFQITLHPPQPQVNVTTKLTRHTTTTTPSYDPYNTYDDNQVIYSQPSDELLKTLNLFNRMKAQKMPKRIQIHSHSYKYNIEYQDELPPIEKYKGFSALFINHMIKQNAAKKNKQSIQSKEFKTSHSDIKNQIQKASTSANKLTSFIKSLDLSQAFHGSTSALMSATPTSGRTHVTTGSPDWGDYLGFTTRKIARLRQKRFTWRLPSRNLLAKSSTPALNTMSVIVTSSMTPGKREGKHKQNKEPRRKGDATAQLRAPVIALDSQMYKNDTEIKSNKEAEEDQNARIDKRESSEFYTAKDVAALEVIIDLIKSTVSEEELSSATPTPSLTHSMPDLSPAFSPTSFSLSPPEFPVTNSIQVHIALPNFLDTELKSNKRSIDRLRKVFSAKMYTPVDLEYQIHSFDESPETTTAVPTTTMLPPGMYLLVENCNASMPRGSFILKPIAHSINLANISVNGIKVRQAEARSEQTRTEKVTTPSDKLSKVTLSKDFIAAINKHLMQLYESLHANTESDRKITRNVERTTNANATKRTRRGLNWKNIRKYFHTSKHCDCKANRTMCRACAASDAVMGELIFELNNLVKYMNDHCAEIQTYFRSNPSGGRKLRDAVRKVDQSLDTYYKRVKGKCKVKTCCDTYTFINKRELINANATGSDSRKHYMKLADDLESFAHDINNASKLNICYNDALKKGTYKLFGVVAKCTNQSNNSSSVNKNKSAKGNYKNVYALDNVNVNIICNNDSSNKQLLPANQDANRYGQHLLDYFADDSENNNNEKKRKWFFKNIFRRKENNHNAYPKLDKFRKREVQIDNPLNADTGGSFWSDYVHKIQTDRPRLVRQTNKRETERAPKNAKGSTTSIRNDPVSVTVRYRSTTAGKKTIETPIGTQQTKGLTIEGDVTDKAIEESLNYNINELFKLLGNVYIADTNETTFNTGTTSSLVKVNSTREITTLKPNNCKKKKNKGKCKVCKKNKCKCANKKKTTKNTTKRTDITSLTLTVKTKTKGKTKPKTKTTKPTTKPVANALPTKSLLELGDVNATGIWAGIPLNSVPTGVTQLIDTISKIKNTTMAYVNSYYGQHITSKINVNSTGITKDNQISKLLHMLGARSFSDKNKEDNTVMNTEIEITSDENPTILIINDDELGDGTEEAANTTETTKKSTTTAEQNTEQTTKLANDQPETTSDRTEKITNASETKPTAAQTSKLTNLKQSKHKSIHQKITTNNTANVTKPATKETPESTEESFNTDETQETTEEKGEETTRQWDGDTKGDAEITDGRTENVVKSLLLSVLKFETKRLDSEYERLVGRGAEDSVAPRAAERPADDIINVRIKMASLLQKQPVLPSLNTTSLPTRLTTTPVATTTPFTTPTTWPSTTFTTTTSRLPTVTSHTDYDLFGPLYDLAHDLPIASRLGHENIVNKFLHKFVVKTKNKEEPGVEVHLHSAKGPMLHSTLQSAVTKDGREDSDSEGIISAALILRDHKEEQDMSVPAKGPVVTVQTSAPTKSSRSYLVVKAKETCETPKVICDLQDTFAHLLYCQQQLKPEYYDRFLKTMTCNKYLDAPDYFFIKYKANKYFCFSKDEILDKMKGKGTFDWIRSKRDLTVSDNGANNNGDDGLDGPVDVGDDSGKANGDKDPSDAAYSLVADVIPDDGFETMVKDQYGIYRSVEMTRVKRSTDDLVRIGKEMRNLPPIDIPKNKIFAIEGETVTLKCVPQPDRQERLTWWVDTPHAQDNVMVDGEHLVITAVKPANAANYTCGQGNTVINATGLRIVSLPIYDIVTTPLYICNYQCSDYELKMMHELGPQMTDVGCVSESCSITIDRPRCLTDLASNASLLSVRATMRLPRRGPPCGIEGARDAHGSLAVVAATSAPLLARIPVVVERSQNNVTLTPTTDDRRRLILAMMLPNDPNIINQAPFSVVPGDIQVVVSCPQGFVLITKLRICMAPTPANDYPDPGRRMRLRRYDWWKWPLWCVVVGGVLAVGGACGGAAAVRRAGRPRRDKQTTQLMFHRVSAAASSASGAAPAPRRRISPSRVILPRLFRHASSKMSQEMKLDSAKKHHAPPLPPIDFDS